ncbi:MAG TPA: transposase [Terriglobales bacterium]|nr:transposase [Terriglobales bacterium]
MKPLRAHNFGTHFVGTQTASRDPLFISPRYAELLIETLYHYRNEFRFKLHEFVVMPNHLHLILTPAETLEKAMQLIKGGFSFRLKKDLKKSHEVWQKSFTDYRLRNNQDWLAYREYLWFNPVKAGLCKEPAEYSYSSATGKYELDPLPQRLKPDAD